MATRERPVSRGNIAPRRQVEPITVAQLSTLIWTPSALGRWGAAVGLGAIGCITGWYLVSGESVYVDQIAGINVAIVSLVVANAASIGLLLSGRRAVGVRRLELLGEAADVLEAPRVTEIEVPVQRGPVALVGATGLVRYHRADCQLATGRHWPPATRVQHEKDGRTPCGVCQP